MPLQNRCDPFGALIATSARGTMMGNRGGKFHRDDRTLGGRRWSSRHWICCDIRGPYLWFFSDGRNRIDPRRERQDYAGYRRGAQVRRLLGAFIVQTMQHASPPVPVPVGL